MFGIEIGLLVSQCRSLLVALGERSMDEGKAGVARHVTCVLVTWLQHGGNVTSQLELRLGLCGVTR